MGPSELKALSERIKAAEIAMLQQLRASRPIKDAAAPSVEDREAQARGRAAEVIAEYNHLMRLWELETEFKEMR